MSERLMQLVRLLIPRACPACGRQLGAQCGICQDCLAILTPTIESHSPLSKTAVPHLITLGRHTGKIRRLVRALKFEGARDLAQPLAQKLAAHVPQQWQVVAVVAVPLHPKRQRQRGYNQAELLARGIARELDVPYLPLLKRTRHTAQQAKQRGQNRRDNVAAAFTINPQSAKPEGTVLLIDDVCTTGATLQECRTVLEQAGIWGLCYGVIGN